MALLLPLALAACATTGSGGRAITVETASRGQALSGADCTISIGAGSWNVVTPASVPIESASGDLHVVCNKNGFRTSELIVKPSNPVGSSMGVGLGGGTGNVGIGVGLNFPINMGGGGYPSRVIVELTPQ